MKGAYMKFFCLLIFSNQVTFLIAATDQPVTARVGISWTPGYPEIARKKLEEQKPNRQCYTGFSQGKLFVNCNDAHLDIPGNFNVSRMPSEVNRLYLGCQADSFYRYAYEHNILCNIMKKNAQPFPALSKLDSVELKFWQGENRGRFRLNILLANLGPYLKYLMVSFSRIGSLEADYFKGFTALETLHLDHNEIVDVSPHFFASLSPGVPALRSVGLRENRISSFDWGSLQPVATTLSTIDLGDQRPGLQSLNRSTTTKFSFKNITTVDLSGNNLIAMPKEILETLTEFSKEGVLMFTRNPACPKLDCSCCTMKDFFSWIADRKQHAKADQGIRVAYTCGDSETRERFHLLEITHANFALTVREVVDGNRTEQKLSFDPDTVVHC